MSEISATPSEAASPAQPQAPSAPETPSLDDRLAAKFGFGDSAQPETPQAETPAAQESPVETQAESDEPVIEEEAPVETPVAETFRIKHNGEEKDLPLSEAQRLVQMGYDYEFKMQRVNSDIAATKSMREALQAREQAQAQVFGAMVEVAAIQKQLAPYANVDWVAESNADPIRAFQLRAQHDALVENFYAAQQKVQQAMQPAQQATQQIDHAALEIEQKKLLDKVPEWKDDGKRQADQKSIKEAMVREWGFAEQEIGGPILNDHRVISILRDAWKYRQALANSKAKKTQPQGLPKAATPGPRVPPRSEAQQLGDVKRALNQPNISREQRKAAENELIARKFRLK